MKLVSKDNAVIFKNSNTSQLLEYSLALGRNDIDFCINIITGRYPETGFCTNEECNELCYILEGEGSINLKDKIVNFNQGDLIYIDKKDIYYWNGKCKIIMICTPAWYKEQCKLFNN